MQKEKKIACSGNGGFSLIELLIAMVVGGMVVFAVYTIYMAQQRAYTAQLAVTEMQQNMRVAIDMLSYDIRMTGYQSDDKPASAGIVAATSDIFSVSFDLNENGTVNNLPADQGESIAYNQYVALVNGKNIPVLGRSISGGAAQPAVENVEHLRFRYLKSLPGGGVPVVVAAMNTDIHYVQVDVVVRASREDPDFLNTQTYIAADGVTTFGGAAKNDGFRRRHQTFLVECRNINN